MSITPKTTYFLSKFITINKYYCKKVNKNMKT